MDIALLHESDEFQERHTIVLRVVRRPTPTELVGTWIVGGGVLDAQFPQFFWAVREAGPYIAYRYLAGRPEGRFLR